MNHPPPNPATVAYSTICEQARQRGLKTADDRIPDSRTHDPEKQSAEQSAQRQRIENSKKFLFRLKPLHLEKIQPEISVLISSSGVLFTCLNRSIEHPACAEIFVQDEDFIDDLTAHLVAHDQIGLLKSALDL